MTKPNPTSEAGKQAEWEYTCRYCHKARPKPGEMWGIHPEAVCSCDFYSMLTFERTRSDKGEDEEKIIVKAKKLNIRKIERLAEKIKAASKGEE